MKTTTVAMRAHLDGTVTTLATIIKITRVDGTSFHFTDHDRDIVFGSNIYVAQYGYDRTAVKSEIGLAVDNLDINLFIAGVGTDLRAGLFDRAEIRFSVVNWTDPDTFGEIKFRRGTLGDVSVPLEGNLFKAEVRGMAQALAQNLLQVYQPECRTDLGSTLCKIAIYPAVLGRLHLVTVGQAFRVATAVAFGQAQYENRVYRVTIAGTTAAVQPVYDTTIGNPTVDGSATLVAENAFMRDAVVATVTDRRVFTITVDEARGVDGWFDGGGLTFEDGNNAGLTQEIKTWIDSSNTVTLFEPAPYDIQVGDNLRLYAGCDKRRETCRDKFSNVLNFRGEPDLPGIGKLQRIKGI